MSKLNTKRYLNGVKWLEEHGFVAFDDEPCYSWSKDGIEVCFIDEGRSEWCATTREWLGDCGTTPKSALSRMREAFEQTRDSFLKQAQECVEIIERVDKALEEE